MSETKTLWQRCEALGQFEDFKDDHVSMRFSVGRWLIEHDGHIIIYIHQRGMQGSEWLADAILAHMERIRFPMPTIKPLEEMGEDEKAAFMKAMNEWTRGPMTFVPNESVVTMQNINEKLREAIDCGQYDHDTDGRHRDPNFKGVPLDSVPLPIPNKLPDVTYVVEAPKPTEPTQEPFKALMAFVRKYRHRLGFTNAKIMELSEATGDSGIRILSPDNSPNPMRADLSEDASGSIEFRSNVPFTDICEMIGFDATEAIEAHKSAQPTQEQLKAIWDHVTHLTGEQAESFGFQYAVIGNAAQAQFELHIKSLGSRFGEWQIRIMHGHIGRYWWENPFDLVTTVHLLRMEMTIPTEQWVFEEPQQFVSIPVTEWQQLREAAKTIQSILFPEIKDVEFES